MMRRNIICIAAIGYYGSEKIPIIDGSMLQRPIQNLQLPLEGQNSAGLSDGQNHM